MKSPIKSTRQKSLFFELGDTLSQKHPLYQLSNRIDWNLFEEAFSPLYCPNNGRFAKPIQLICGLLVLKHVRYLTNPSLSNEAKIAITNISAVSKVWWQQHRATQPKWSILDNELVRKE